MAKPRARTRPGGLTSSPNTAPGAAPGAATNAPTGDGPTFSGTTTLPGGSLPNTLEELSTADGRVKSYAVNFGGLRLVLKSEADRTFTLDNTEPHYGSVLSMVIAAAAKDEILTVGWSRRSVSFRIAAIGLGTEPTLT